MNSTITVDTTGVRREWPTPDVCVCCAFGWWRRTVMAKTLLCIHFSRTVLALMILLFILVSILKLSGFPYMPSPDYSPVVFILLDLVLVVGLISAATQHLKTLIVFGWLMALTFLLIFFGNTVSSQYQSDLWGKYLSKLLYYHYRFTVYLVWINDPAWILNYFNLLLCFLLMAGNSVECFSPKLCFHLIRIFLFFVFVFLLEVPLDYLVNSSVI